MCELSRFEDEDAKVIPMPRAGVTGVLADRSHPQRQELESFVERRFAEAYGASVVADYPLIAGLVTADGEVLAAVGVRLAEDGPLFLERYLDVPVEDEVGRVLSVTARRDEIVEIGAFASNHPAWSMQLFDTLPPWLVAVVGRRYAVATLRPELSRLLGRSGFDFRPVAGADPGLLGDAAAAWGSYYDGSPVVYAGHITGGSRLAALRERLRKRDMERQVRRVLRASA